MALLTTACIQAIREANDIVDVVGEYVRLVGRDPQFMASCPFHNETKPSMSVRRDRQFFYCFGCLKKGDVFRFIEEIECLDFLSAAEFLARRSGVPLVYQEGHAAPAKDPRRLDLLEWAAQQFQKAFRTAPVNHPARQLVQLRGMSLEETERFRLGLDPDWSYLLEAGRRDGFSSEQLLAADLAARSERTGKPYDRFHHRLIFPIAEVSGRVVGFGGRRLNDNEDSPKYTNSPDSPLFHKSRLLYGAPLARAAVGERRQVVVAEGYIDVIALHRAGYPEAVAPMGTALTREHVRTLRSLRGVERIVLVFDGDTAGVRRASDVVRSLLDIDYPLLVALLPEGMDPDDMMRAGRGGELRACIDGAKDGLEFVLDRMMEQHPSPERHERLKILREMLPLLAQLPSLAARMSYTGTLANRLGMERSTVEAELRALPTHPARAARVSSPAYPPVAPMDPVRLGLLRVLLYAHEVRGESQESFWHSPLGLLLLERMAPGIDEAPQGPCAQCLSEVFRRLRHGQPVDPAALALERRDWADVLTETAVVGQLPQGLEKYVEQSVRRLLLPRLDDQCARLRRALAGVTRTDAETLEQLRTYEQARLQQLDPGC